MDRYYSVDKIPLSIHCLATVEKLFHICQKALARIWKSFSSSVKNIKPNEFSISYPLIGFEQVALSESGLLIFHLHGLHRLGCLLPKVLRFA